MSNRAKWIWAVAAGLLVAVVPSLAGPQTDLSSLLQLGGGLLATLPVLFAAGVLTSLTPCVYPLIPITVSIFGARQASRPRAAALSGTYVLGIASMYSLLGVLAASSGRAFGAYMGNPWVVGVFALVMVVFAASMFGAFEIALPAALQQKLQGVAGAGFGSAFAMGLVAGVVAAPCTGPVLGAVLTYVASTRDLWLGFWMMFAYALGMGLLFFLLGTFSLSLPRSGAWMETVKSVLGIALVMVAISFVRPLLPAAAAVAAPALLVAALAVGGVVVAVLIGAIHRSFHGTAADKALKAGGLALVVVAVSLRLGWIIEPAARAQPAPAGEVAVPERIQWLHSEAEALARAQATGKPVLVDFFATWCAACVELDKHTFTDARVRAEVTRRFIPLKVDGTEDTDEVRALQSKYGVVGLPLVTVVAPDGKQLPQPKVNGFLAAEAFLAELARVK